MGNDLEAVVDQNLKVWGDGKSLGGQYGSLAKRRYGQPYLYHAVPR